jgi:hypothetical protein
MTALRGSCLYAGVRFEIDGLDAMLHCHCGQRQKRYGAIPGVGPAADS